MADDFDSRPDAAIELTLDPAFLARYLAGECTRDDARCFERWLAEHPEHEGAIAQLRDTRRVAGELNGETYDIDTEWQKLWSRQDIAPPSSRPPLQLTIPRRSSRLDVLRRIGIAAALAATVGGGWIAFGGPSGTPAHAVATQRREIATHAGQRADVYLSDGTHVVLAAGSRLRFTAPLGATSRDVYLEGEALFDVTHQAAWPFLVHTTHGVAEDLGTKFTVRSFFADSLLSVAVAEGTVALRRDVASAAPVAILARGDLGTISRTGAVRAERHAELQPYLAWTEGRLVFTDTKLRDALPQLERWYDVELRVADSSLASRRLTAALATTSADEMVRYLAIALSMRYERHGRVVTFVPMPTDATR